MLNIGKLPVRSSKEPGMDNNVTIAQEDTQRFLVGSVSVSVFIAFMIFGSYVFLIIGVVVKKYTFLIPYFTLCVLLILILTLKFFVQLMSTANTHDTLAPHQLHKLVAQVRRLHIYAEAFRNDFRPRSL